MSLLNIRKDSGEKPTDPPASNHASAAAPKGTSMRPSSDRLAHLESKLAALAKRVSSLEGFQSEQEDFNAGTQDRVGKLQRHAGSLCPCCGQPTDTGEHGVFCFTATASDGR